MTRTQNSSFFFIIAKALQNRRRATSYKGSYERCRQLTSGQHVTLPRRQERDIREESDKPQMSEKVERKQVQGQRDRLSVQEVRGGAAHAKVREGI